MFPSDVADFVAAHFDETWQVAAATREDALARLRAAAADPALPALAREGLIEVAARRLHARGQKDVDRKLYARLEAVLAARLGGALDGVRGPLDEARRALADCEQYLEIASGWAEGCEIEMRLLERTVLRATLGLADSDGVAAAAAVVTADVEHAALIAQVAAYARASTARTQAVARAVGHRQEASYLVLRLLELASLVG